MAAYHDFTAKFQGRSNLECNIRHKRRTASYRTWFVSPLFCYEYVREGDTLYVESISRLGRSTKDLLNIIDTLTDKGVTLISHKEKIDTDTPTGKFMLTVFAALSQLEREQLKQRQREGIEIAKAQGKYTGRKPIEIDWTRFGE